MGTLKTDAIDQDHLTETGKKTKEGHQEFLEAILGTRIVHLQRTPKFM